MIDTFNHYYKEYITTMQQQSNNPQTQPTNASVTEKTKEKKTKDLKSKKGGDKTLMRLEQPIYELKKKDEGDAEYVIRKLMDRKQIKPKIGVVQRSPLFSQLASILPAIKKANQQLKNRTIPENQKIDAKIEQVSESSSSSDDENEQQMREQKTLKIKKNSQEMIDESQESKESPNTNQIQLNFLRYEYSQNLPSVEVQPEKNKEQIKESKATKVLIEEL